MSDSAASPSLQEQALIHVRRCDDIFDGRGVRQDREFAYIELRQLALELLEEVEKCQR